MCLASIPRQLYYISKEKEKKGKWTSEYNARACVCVCVSCVSSKLALFGLSVQCGVPSPCALFGFLFRHHKVQWDDCIVLPEEATGRLWYRHWLNTTASEREREFKRECKREPEKSKRRRRRMEDGEEEEEKKRESGFHRQNTEPSVSFDGLARTMGTIFFLLFLPFSLTLIELFFSSSILSNLDMRVYAVHLYPASLSPKRKTDQTLVERGRKKLRIRQDWWLFGDSLRGGKSDNWNQLQCPSKKWVHRGTKCTLGPTYSHPVLVMPVCSSPLFLFPCRFIHPSILFFTSTCTSSWTVS